MIDITITATIRPDILKTTLDSFFNNCFYKFIKDNGLDCLNIIINVDPVGDTHKYNQYDVVDVCKEFTDSIKYNCPQQANFAKAVKWVWYQTTSDYIFHLEDDWLLNRKVDLQKVIDYLNDTNLSSIRFYKNKYPSEKPYMISDVEYVYDNDELFTTLHNNNQFSLNPNIIKKSFIDEALELMTDDINPEKQFRCTNPVMKDFVLSNFYGVYGRPYLDALVSDNGRIWRKNRKLIKPSGSVFTEWVSNQ